MMLAARTPVQGRQSATFQAYFLITRSWADVPAVPRDDGVSPHWHTVVLVHDCVSLAADSEYMPVAPDRFWAKQVRAITLDAARVRHDASLTGPRLRRIDPVNRGRSSKFLHQQIQRRLVRDGIARGTRQLFDQERDTLDRAMTASQTPTL
jgi:hypothetical protein